MPLYRCVQCGCFENTATSRYHDRQFEAMTENRQPEPDLCSECDPKVGSWHGKWPKGSAEGWFVCDRGFIYRPNEVDEFPNSAIIGQIVNGEVIPSRGPKRKATR